MKLYNSFLVRCWLIRDVAQCERAVIDIEHIQTGGRRRAASLSEAAEWMLEACRAARSVGEVTQDSEPGRNHDG